MTIQDCVDLKKAKDRLACYDTIARSETADESTRSRPSYRERVPEPSERVEAVVNVESGANRVPAIRDEPAADADEGKPRRNWFTLRKKPREQTEDKAPIARATIEGVYELSRGTFRLLFDNGEVWQELEYEVRTKYTVGDEVEIRRGTFGTYLLHSLATGRSTKVKRLDP